jgi:hypothetical protein
MFSRWNNLPWTPRGLKVKNAIEVTLAVVALFALMCEPKGWQ